jgi:hypothetical protein
MIKVGSIVKYVGYKGNGSGIHGFVLSTKLHKYQVHWYNGVISFVDEIFVEIVEQ